MKFIHSYIAKFNIDSAFIGITRY